jgi:hypothetical protein
MQGVTLAHASKASAGDFELLRRHFWEIEMKQRQSRFMEII